MTPTPRAVRVLHVAQPTGGGVARYVEEAAARQLRLGWDVAVACPASGGLARRLAEAGIPHVPWEAGRSPGPRVPMETLRLRRAIRAYGPDVVHLHSAKAGLAGRLPAPPARRGRPRPKVIFQPHGWSWLAASGAQAAASRMWERAAARRADLVVCVGTGELQHGVRAAVRARYKVVRNGVDRRRFAPAGEAERRAARDALGLPRDAPLAVCLGRVTRQKGQDVLLAAWPSVRARCPGALLALVGEDATAALADPAAPGRGEAGQVSVQGGLRLVPPVEDPRRWLAAADVVVMPSRWEGLPLTALEALATGRPLVGSAVPGLVEAAGPGTGALVPPEDVPALAAAVAARLLDPVLAAAEGRAGTAWVEDFDADGTFALLAGVTWGLVGGGGDGGVAGVGAWPGPAADGADPVAVLDGEGAGPV